MNNFFVTMQQWLDVQSPSLCCCTKSKLDIAFWASYHWKGIWRLLSPDLFYRWSKWGPWKWSYLSKVAASVRDTTRAQTHISFQFIFTIRKTISGDEWSIKYENYLDFLKIKNTLKHSNSSAFKLISSFRGPHIFYTLFSIFSSSDVFERHILEG